MTTTRVLGPFDNSTRRLCTEVPLLDDSFCESNPFPEDFSVSMVTSHVNVTVVPRRIGVSVDDSGEPECSKYYLIFNQNYELKWRRWKNLIHAHIMIRL